MRTKVLIAVFALFAFSFSFAQGRGNGKGWKNKNKHFHKHEHKMQKHRYKEMAKYERKRAHEEWKNHKEVRKAQLKHMKHCNGYCDHAFYHNDDYYYEDDVYYSRRYRRPVTIDAEVFFRNGAIRVSL